MAVLTVIVLLGGSLFWGKIGVEAPRESAPEETQTESEEEETPSAELPTETEYETDGQLGVVYEESGIWVLLEQAADDENGQTETQQSLLFASIENYVYTKTFLQEESYQLTLYNYLTQEAEITLIFSSGEECVTIGGRIAAGESSALNFTVETTGSYSCSVLCETKQGQVLDAYIGSAEAMEILCDMLAEQELPENYECNVNLFGSFNTYEYLLCGLPYCTNLVWNRNAPDAEQIARAANISVYNGVDMSEAEYGGRSAASITAASLLCAENAVLQRDLQFEIYGNTITVAIPYYVEESQMAAMHVSLQCEGGTVSYAGEGVNADGTFDLTKETRCTVTDADGGARTYALTGERLVHNIPVVYIYTENEAEITSQYTYINATFSMDASHVDGVDSVEECSIRIRGRGHSTWNRWPKKSFRLKFDENTSIFGLEKDKDWVMISNYYDRSLTRNYLAFALSSRLDNLEYTPVSNLVDVFLNGQYIGVYGLGDQVEVDEGRIEIETDETAVDSGFLIEVGGSGRHTSFSAGLLQNVEIHYPDTPTGEQLAYIKNYIAMVDDAIVNGGNYEDYIDVDSFIDWLILEEFCYNWDAGFTRNVYMYKEPGGKLKFGPVWDFDLAMGSVGYDDWTYQSWATSMNGLVGTTWTTYLLEDPAFMERLKARWLEVRDDLMETVDSELAQMLVELEPSYEENYWRWMQEVEGQNIAWEWEMEYTQRTLGGLYGYLQSVFDYRYEFMNKCIIDGYICPKKPKKDDTSEEETEEETASEESQEEKG